MPSSSIEDFIAPHKPCIEGVERLEEHAREQGASGSESGRRSPRRRGNGQDLADSEGKQERPRSGTIGEGEERRRRPANGGDQGGVPDADITGSQGQGRGELRTAQGAGQSCEEMADTRSSGCEVEGHPAHGETAAGPGQSTGPACGGDPRGAGSIPDTESIGVERDGSARVEESRVPAGQGLPGCDSAGAWPDYWAVEPNVGRVANGVANRVDRLKAIGNGQVPLVAAQAWSILTSSLSADMRKTSGNYDAS